MAVTRGYVQGLNQAQNTACVQVGPHPNATELFLLTMRSGDEARDVLKRTMLTSLTHFLTGGQEVDIDHDTESAEILSVSSPRYDVAAHPLQMEAVEVTQGIQDLAGSVPLIAGKRTAVRVYLTYYATPGVTVRGELAVRRGPSEPVVTVPSTGTASLDAARAGDMAAARHVLGHSLTFLLPDSLTEEGPLAISLGSVTDTATGSRLAVARERRPVVWFGASPPLRLRLLGLRYTAGNPPVTHSPTANDFAMLLSWLRRAYPVGRVISTQAVVDATATAPFGCDDANAQIQALRDLDMSAGEDQRTHYYGLVSDGGRVNGGFFMRGCAEGVPVTSPAPDTVASGPTGDPAGSFPWDTDTSYGDWYGGHELGHTLGRLHPGFCGESSDDLRNYPYDGGRLAGSDTGFAGFDVGDPALGLPMAVLPGRQWTDVMTYCEFEWLSAYTYRGVRRRLFAEDRMGPRPSARTPW
ncbi:hypothetical protein [Streptomyces sp. URMC 123]|uniref:hypothetical protein n=1 Tax=Streptomyces sp. URMC 123 TaxID=3423403 RepID=UPI003F1CF33A